jgi:hypothetical protein
LAAFVVLVVCGCLAAACVGGLGPSAVTKLCGGQLYCGSSSVPQTVSGGTCCASQVVDFNGLTTSTFGYMCAFGSSKQPVGCYRTLDIARQVCPTAPSIILCQAE